MSRRKRRLVLILAALCVVLSFASCSFIRDLLGDDSTKPPPSGDGEVTVLTIIAELSRSLTDAGYSPSVNTAVNQGATAAVNEETVATGIPLADLELMIPVATGGAVEALESLSVTDDERIALLNCILESFVTSLNDRFDATSDNRSLRSLSSSAAAVNALLARISKAAVENLARSGIDPDRRGEAAGAVVGTMVSSLDGGGVNKILVNDAVGKITLAALSSLKEAGLSEAAALSTAVQTITQGAITAITSIQVAGVTSADYPALSSEITRSAAAAVGGIATDKAEAESLVKSVATGATAGLVAIKTADATTDVAVLVQSITSGATVGIMGTTFVDANDDAMQFIGAVTQSASIQLDTDSTALGVEKAALYSGVTSGAAAAAQQIISGGYNAAFLTDAIVLKDALGGTVAVVGADITAGIAIGSNTAPVADAGDDKSITIGASVILDASGSSDPDDDALSFAWSFTQKPAGSTTTLTTPLTIESGFTPDRVGAYIVELRVSDGKTTSTSYCTILVSQGTTTATWLGLTAEQRMTAVQDFFAQEEYQKAKDECLLILARYPESNLFPEVMYRLGDAWRYMGNPDAALEYYYGIIEGYPSVDTSIKAKVRIAQIRLGGRPNATLTEAQTLLAEVNSLNLVDETGWDAKMLSAQLLGRTDKPGARTAYVAIRDAAGAPHIYKFWAQEAIATLLRDEKSWAEALAAYELLGTPAYTSPGGVLEPYLLYTARIGLNWFYQAKDKANGNIDSKAARISVLQDIVDDTRLLSWQRLYGARFLGEAYMWDWEQNLANFDTSRATIEAGLTDFGTGTAGTAAQRGTALAWTRLRRIQAYQKLYQAETVVATKNAYGASLISGAESLIADYGTAWFALRPPAEARVLLGEHYLWRTKEYAKAEAVFLQVVNTYPAYLTQEPKAKALLGIGNLYYERAWRTKDNAYGGDFVALYQRGISWYSQVTPASFPYLSASQWFFLEARRDIADCYAGMGEHLTAVEHYEDFITFSNGADPISEAWCWLGIGNAWGEEILLLVQAGGGSNWEEAQNLYEDHAKPAYEEVLGFMNSTTPGDYVDKGSVAAEALFEHGYLLREVGQLLQDNGSEPDVYEPVYEAALVYLAQVNYTNFPALLRNRWYFHDSLQHAGYCYIGLRRWAEARASYQTIIDLIDDGDIDEYRLPRAMRNLANTYRKQAESTPTSLERINLYQLAIESLREVVDLGLDLDGGDGAAWALQSMGWAYNQLVETIRDYSGSWNAVVGYDIPALLEAAHAAADELIAYGAEDLLPDLEAVGYAHLHKGYFYDRERDFLSETVPGFDDEDRAELMVAALAEHAKVAEIDDADPWCTMEARKMRLDLHLELATIQDLVPNFQAAEDLWASIYADPEGEPSFGAMACRSMGWACINFGPDLVTDGTHQEIVDEVAWRTLAAFYFDLVLDPDGNFSMVDDWTIDSCEEGKLWLLDNPPTP